MVCRFFRVLFLAATGLRLDHFYAGHPTCSPTRGSVLTGRHPNRYGTFAPGWSLRPEEISIAHLLRKAGYICGHFGKWHVGPVKAGSPTNPGAMGFDEWVSHDNFFELNPVFSRNGGPPEAFEGESSAVVIDETLRFIKRAQQAGKPFLAVVWFGSPHEPYSGLPQDLALYDDLPTRVMLENRFKLVLHDEKSGGVKKELFELHKDPAETRNLYQTHPDMVITMEEELRQWQQSVLRSLTGADYEN